MSPPLDPSPLQGAWALQDNPIDYTKAKLGLKRIYVDIRDEYAPAVRAAEVRSRGFIAGVYWGANWGEQTMSPDKHAELIDLKIRTMEAEWRKTKSGSQCEFQLDYENHDPVWILAWLKRWRELRPTKRLTWTFEAHQGGWFTKPLVDFINGDPNLILLPQLYNGAMEPVGVSMDGLDAVLDLVYYGINIWRIQGFYDAREIPIWWRGFLFTLESA